MKYTPQTVSVLVSQLEHFAFWSKFSWNFTQFSNSCFISQNVFLPELIRESITSSGGLWGSSINYAMEIWPKINPLPPSPLYIWKVYFNVESCGKPRTNPLPLGHVLTAPLLDKHDLWKKIQQFLKKNICSPLYLSMTFRKL